MAHPWPAILVLLGLAAACLVMARRSRPGPHPAAKRGAPRPHPRPLDGLLRDRRPAAARQALPEMSDPALRGADHARVVAAILARTCDEVLRDVRGAGPGGRAIRFHLGRRGALLVAVSSVDLRGAIAPDPDRGEWRVASRAGARTVPDPMAVLAQVAVEAGLDPGRRARLLVAVPRGVRFEGKPPRGTVTVDDLERRVVEMSDRARGEDGAIAAMRAMRSRRDGDAAGTAGPWGRAIARGR